MFSMLVKLLEHSILVLIRAIRVKNNDKVYEPKK